MRVQDGVRALRRLWPVIAACGLISALLMWFITPVTIDTERKVANFDAIATLFVAQRAPLQEPGRPPVLTSSPRASAQTPTPTPTVSPTASPTPPRGTATPARTRTATRTSTPTPTPTLGYADRDPGRALGWVALLVTTGEIPGAAAESLGYSGDPAALTKEITVQADPESSSVRISMSSKESGPAVETVNAFARAAVAYFEGPGRYIGVDVALLEEATPLPGVTTEDYVAPPSKRDRALLAGLVGLVLGLGLVLIVDRMGPRLRARREVAKALAVPVFAEIPRKRRRRARDHEVVLLDAPDSSEADGYRVLKSAVLHNWTPEASAQRGGSAYVFVVTDLAGGADEVLTNMAAALATDMDVLVVDGDLRNPGLERWLDLPPGEGVGDFLADSGDGLERYCRPTRIPGTRFISAGTDTSQPVVVGSQLGKAIAEAKHLADVVIVKAPPVLVASEVFDLLPLADMVLVSVRSGRLEPAAAARAREMLHRFPQVEAGVVLLDIEDGLFGIGTKDRQFKSSKRK